MTLVPQIILTDNGVPRKARKTPDPGGRIFPRYGLILNCSGLSRDRFPSCEPSFSQGFWMCEDEWESSIIHHVGSHSFGIEREADEDQIDHTQVAQE